MTPSQTPRRPMARQPPGRPMIQVKITQPSRKLPKHGRLLRAKRHPYREAAGVGLLVGGQLGWHHRHTLPPFAWLAATIAAGIVVEHAAHPYRLALAASAVLVPVAYIAGARIDNHTRGWFAAWVTACCTTWLLVPASGADIHALTWTLLPDWLLLTGLPWWWHWRMRGPGASWPAEHPIRVWAEYLAAPGHKLPESKVRTATTVSGGSVLVVDLPRGLMSSEDVVRAIPQVASAYKVPWQSVSVEMAGSEATVKVSIFTRNPLDAVSTWRGPDLDRKIRISSIGRYPDLERVAYRWTRENSGAVHDLISGTTDSGKSRLLDLLLATSRHGGNGLIVDWVIDPQMGQSLPDWQDAVDWFARGTAEGLRMLRTAHRLMLARNDHLSKVAWTDDRGRRRRGKAFFEASREMPLIVITIDEAHALLAIPEAAVLAAAIAKMSRKCGIKLRIVTQVPTVDQLGGSLPLRDMIAAGNVIVLRTASAFTGQVAFNGALPVLPHRIPKELPSGATTSGLGFALGVQTRASTMRLDYLDDPHHWATTGTTWTLGEQEAAWAGAVYAGRNVIEGEIVDDDPSAPTSPVDVTVENFGDAVRLMHARAVDIARAAGRDNPDDADWQAALDAMATAGVGQEPPRRVLAEDAVLDHVRRSDGPVSRGEICKALSPTWAMRSITDALTKLVTSGHLAQPDGKGSGRYQLGPNGGPK